MKDRRNASSNIDIFFDLMKASIKDQKLQETLHNCSIVPLPEDDPKLARFNFENAQNLPSPTVVFLGVSKSEGSQNYDTFVIKESPIILPGEE